MLKLVYRYMLLRFLLARWLLATVFVFYGSVLSGHASDGGNLLPPVDLDKVGVEAYEPGLIRIRFTPAVGHGLAEKMIQKSADGIVKTGFPAFDVLSKQHMLVEARPLLDAVYQASPELVKYRARHEAHGLHLWYEFQTLAKDEDIVSAVRAYQELTEVEVAEPVYRIRLVEPDVDAMHPLQDNGQDDPSPNVPHAGWIPNDPLFSGNQWHFNNTGQMIGGVAGLPGADIGMPGAWDIQSGSTSVIVAVLDSGVQHDHPDLAGNMWSGTGYNFVDDTAAIVPGNHGTHVAGTVAAVSNNGTGVAGIAGGSGSDDGVRIMSLQILRGGVSGGIMAAFVFAADHGAAITQNSWGYAEAGLFNQSDLDGIDYFNANGGGSALSGGLSVFAAGNSNSRDDWYPAYYSGTLAVSSTDNRDVRTPSSNYGRWIDLSAPGSWVFSTYANSSYGFMSGTSAACSQVSGVAALVVSHAPGQLTAVQVVDLLKSTVDNVYGLNAGYIGLLGTGRLHAYNALLELTGNAPPVDKPAWLTSTPADSVSIEVAWQPNAAKHPIMLAWSDDGVFGNPLPGKEYVVGDTLPGGGEVLFLGSGESFSHEDLSMNDPNYYKAWSLDAEYNYSGGILSSAKILASYTILATFNAGGSIVPSGSLAVNMGEDQLFRAIPQQGYYIADLEVNGSSLGPVPSYLFTNVKTHHNIHANFQEITHTITAITSPGGTVSPTGEVEVADGHDQLFQISADTGCLILDVIVDGVSVGAPSSYLFKQVVTDHTIEAVFGTQTFTITATSTEGGEIIPEGEVVAAYGSSMLFSIMQQESYHVADVLVDGLSVGAVFEYVFEEVKQNHTIHAIFEADPEPRNEVVFVVDMQYAEGFIPSSDELYLTGSFYGWEGPGLLLNAKSGQADKSPMVFYGYLELPAGSYAYTYYLNAFPAGAEWEGPVYRTLTVPDTLQTYDVFGYRTDPTSLPLMSDNVTVSVYPNPANELVYITGSVDISQIFLVDMYGRTLLSEAPATNRHQLDLSGVPTGIYLIRVYTRDHGHRTIRLIRK